MVFKAKASLQLGSPAKQVCKLKLADVETIFFKMMLFSNGFRSDCKQRRPHLIENTVSATWNGYKLVFNAKPSFHRAS